MGSGMPLIDFKVGNRHDNICPLGRTAGFCDNVSSMRTRTLFCLPVHEQHLTHGRGCKQL